MNKEAFESYQMGLCLTMKYYPFFFHWSTLLTYADVENNPDIPVMATIPDIKANTFKLCVNPAIIKVLRPKMVMTAIAKSLVEIIRNIHDHKILDHPLGGIAFDLETVSGLIADGFSIPEHPEFPDEPLFVTPEFVVNHVQQAWKALGQEKTVQPAPSGKTSWFYLDWLKTNLPTSKDVEEYLEEQKSQLTEEEMKQLEQAIDELMSKLPKRAPHPRIPASPEQKSIMNYLAAKQASTALANSGGKAPGSIGGDVADKIRALDSQLNWRKHQRRFRGGLGNLSQSYSFARKNKYGSTPKAVYVPGAHVIYVIDVSGSMSTEEIAQGLGEAEEASKHMKVTVIFMDYGDLKEENIIRNFKKRPDRTYDHVGGGGTDMRQVFYWINKNRVQTDGCIIFTDGGTPFPTRGERKGVRTLWIVTDRSIRVPKEAGDSIYMTPSSDDGSAYDGVNPSAYGRIA